MSILLLSIPFWIAGWFWGKYAGLNGYSWPQKLIGMLIIVYFQIRAFQIAGIWT